MVMLNATNGEVVSQTSTLPLLSVLGSSPTVTQDGTKVFVQSKSDGVFYGRAAATSCAVAVVAHRATCPAV